MIHQTKLTDIPNPNKFKNCEFEALSSSEQKFSIDKFSIGHPVDL